MEIDENVARTEITIQGATFLAPQPFSEGYQLKENEAAALNQVLSENLRNNFAKKVSAALEEVEGAVDGLDMDSLQKEFDEYIAGYEFGIRRAGSRVPVDPVEREAAKLAKKRIREALRVKGIAVKDLPEGKFDELVAQLMERDEIKEAAKAMVEATKQATQIDLSDI